MGEEVRVSEQYLSQIATDLRTRMSEIRELREGRPYIRQRQPRACTIGGGSQSEGGVCFGNATAAVRRRCASVLAKGALVWVESD